MSLTTQSKAFLISFGIITVIGLVFFKEKPKPVKAPAPKVEMSQRQQRELMVHEMQRASMKEMRDQGRCTGVFSDKCK